MTDLISRQAAKKAVCSMCRWEGTSNCDECEHPIDELPTIDPVKHGRWKPHPTEPDWDACSVCTSLIRRRFHYNDGVYGGYDVEESFAYCPHCGAKMDKRGKDEAD